MALFDFGIADAERRHVRSGKPDQSVGGQAINIPDAVKVRLAMISSGSSQSNYCPSKRIVVPAFQNVIPGSEICTRSVLALLYAAIYHRHKNASTFPSTKRRCLLDIIVCISFHGSAGQPAIR